MRITLLAIVLSLITLVSFSYSANLKADPQPGDLATLLAKKSRKDLEKIAYYVSSYDQKVRGTIGIIGLPFRKSIPEMQLQDLINFIVYYTKLYPKVFPDINTINKLVGLRNSDKKQAYKDYLNTLPLEQLQKMALAAEAYSRRKEGQEDIMGGLHDYISTLTQDSIVSIILEYCSKYPELMENRLLEILGEGNTMTPDDIRAALKDVDRLTIILWVIACDEYDRERNFRLGGLHEYAYSLRKEELIEILIKFIHNYPELMYEGRLQNLAGEMQQSNPGLFGGIINYLDDFTKEELVALALAAEKYDREQTNIELIGGLHDYVNSLTKPQIEKIMRDFLVLYPALRPAGILESKAGLEQGGFVGYLKSFSLTDIRSLCVSVESYVRKDVEKVDVKDSIHDKVANMTGEECIDFILQITETHVELRTKAKIAEILQKYPVHN